MDTQNSKTLMTQGSISKKIIFFAIPLFLGNLFQQLYNTADSLIVGNFLGSNALAAVSSSGNLIFLMVGFFNGIAMGAGVVMARYYGARQTERLQCAIHTTVAFGLAAGVVLTAVGMIFAPKILVLMGTPAEVLPQSVEYFRMYFAGSVGFVMYNIFVGVHQSVGDSRHPLIYLIVSSCVNVGLDLLFVAVFHMGVGSAALATIISQFVSALLCMRHLQKAPEEYRLYFHKIRLDLPMLKQIIANGLPAGFQNSVIALANVVVQTNINAFGKMAMAGCGAYSKIEGFGFLPVNCFTMALTTFVSQNLGAKEYERAKKGARFGILCSISIAELIGIVIYAAAPLLISAFNSDPDVVAYGAAQARTVTLFYFLLAFSHCIAAILRGSGKSAIPMVVMLCVWCILRVTYITVTVHFIPDIRVVFWAYPLTWSISSAIFLVLFLRGKWVYGFEKRKD
ncbi:MAG: MATE family efflux transporter [Lachnospiraceae bacterium]|nr:MATE family efflux transporter [Lachnospiraceae bacterium]